MSYSVVFIPPPPIVQKYTALLALKMIFSFVLLQLLIIPDIVAAFITDMVIFRSVDMLVKGLARGQNFSGIDNSNDPYLNE